MAESLSDEELLSRLGRSPAADLSDEEIMSRLGQTETRTPTNLNPAVAEGASALNRGFAAIPDFVIEAANTVIQHVPSARPVLEPILPSGQIPTVQGTLEEATDGTFGARNFMEPGIARDVVQTAGEVAPGLATGATAPVRSAARITRELADDAASQAAQTAGRIRVGDKRTADQAIDAAGQVVSDPAGAAAVRQGFDEGVVATIKSSTANTKAKMREMVAVAKRGINERAFANKNRPADVVGQAVGERITRVAAVNRQAGKEIDAAANALGDKFVDLSGAATSFADDLSRAGVSISGNKVSLKGSDFQDVPGAKETLNLFLRRLDETNQQALPAHRLKRFIDRRISAAKLSEGGLDGDLERLLVGLRRNIDDALDVTFPRYAAANEKFSETKRVLDAFQEAAGKSIDLKSSNATKQIGTLSRRLFSNVQSRVRLMDSLEGLDEIAAKHGADVSDDVFALARFADELDRVFKPVARTSLNAEVAKAARDAIDRGPARSFIDRGIEQGIERVTGINEAGALRAIEELLKP